MYSFEEFEMIRSDRNHNESVVVGIDFFELSLKTVRVRKAPKFSLTK